MPDTFLQAHRIDTLQFSISAPFSPISIRDQMVRSKMFVDRAIEEGLISLERAFLVVGSGAGGATAALYAAWRGIKTALIERETNPFNLQRQCLTRWINPTQYDWPAHHWDLGIFPWTRHPSMPLPWKAHPSNLIAAIWVRELHRAMRKYPSLLQIKFNTAFLSAAFRQNEQDLEVKYEENLAPGGIKNSTEYFGGALYAKGHGTEETCMGTYKGFEFWETDDFEKPNLGLPALVPPSRYKVLICGGGDGALQDFLRITTGQRSATDIMLRIWRFLPKELISWLSSEEDQAYRASLWNNRAQDHPVLERVHQVHRSLVRQVLLPPSGTAIIAELEALLQNSQTLDVTLIHPCTHFSQSYSLNRFLAQLIASYAQMRGLPINIQSKKTVCGVRGTNHTCAGKSSYCHGKEHDVDWGDSFACDSFQVANPSFLGMFHAVILRIGIKKASAPFNDISKLLPARHPIPFHAPA